MIGSTNSTLLLDNDFFRLIKYGHDHDTVVIPFVFASFFRSIWLYAGAGFMLKFARRFDKSLGWFNRRFDIEKHPLSSIGLVAGALVAVVYWGFAVGAHFSE
jgi:hypothetical protein